MDASESGIKVAVLLLVNEIEIFCERLGPEAMYFSELHNISGWPAAGLNADRYANLFGPKLAL